MGAGGAVCCAARGFEGGRRPPRKFPARAPFGRGRQPGAPYVSDMLTNASQRLRSRWRISRRPARGRRGGCCPAAGQSQANACFAPASRPRRTGLGCAPRYTGGGGAQTPDFPQSPEVLRPLGIPVLGARRAEVRRGAGRWPCLSPAPSAWCRAAPPWALAAGCAAPRAGSRAAGAPPGKSPRGPISGGEHAWLCTEAAQPVGRRRLGPSQGARPPREGASVIAGADSRAHQ